MGSKKSKQIKPPVVNNYPRKPVHTQPVTDTSTKQKEEYKLPKKLVKTIPKILPRYKPRRDRLYSPRSKRPIELSWLQQNGGNDNYTRTNFHYLNHHHGSYHHHRRHHHHHHSLHEHDTPIPLAINRWPINNDKFGRSKLRSQPVLRTKSFIDEYVYQKKTTSSRNAIEQFSFILN